MATRERVQDRAAWRSDRLLVSLGEELRVARQERGLSQRAVAEAIGKSHVHVHRLERGRAAEATLRDLVAFSAAVGLDLSVRLFPGSQPVRDAAHLALLGRFIARLGSGWQVRTEAPLPIAGDQRAWDVLLLGPSTIGVEAETRLGDLQALERRLQLKARDGGVEHLILVVNDTRHNRDVVNANAARLGTAFPVPARAALEALAASVCPNGDSLLRL